jgi:hypothetical protein
MDAVYWVAEMVSMAINVKTNAAAYVLTLPATI